jgi:hypothetical protein
VLIFFIAGLLYLLCFEHVDNLGAYRNRMEAAFSSHLFTSDQTCRSSAIKPYAHSLA